MSSSLAGTGALVRFVLRRDRVRLPVWVLSIVGLVWASTVALQDAYPTQADRDLYASTIGGSAASIVMSGPPTALATMGGLTVFEVNSVALLGVALMAVFLVVRHTRAEEEAGRTELVRAAAVGRLATLVAPTLVVGLACVAIGAAVTGVFLVAELPVTGSVTYGAVVAATGLSFAALTLVAAQLTEHGRGALAIGGTALGVTFLLRGIGDVQESWLRWLSPIGWAQATRPFASERWWPLLLVAALVAACVVAVLALVEHRDHGAGMLPTRPGRPRAGAALLAPGGLALRLQRGSLTGWTAGTAVLGLAYGSLASDVESLIAENPQLAEWLTAGGGGDLVDLFFATSLLVMALVASAFAVSSMVRLRSEESAGRAEPLLATALSRAAWAGQGLAVTVAGTVLLLAAGGAAMGLAHGTAVGDPGLAVSMAGDALTYAPAVLVLGAVVLPLAGWAPHLAVAGWVGVAYAFVTGWLAQVLDLPTWVVDVSPLSHVPQVPSEPVSAGPLLWLSAVAAALAVAGLVGLRRRDIG